MKCYLATEKVDLEVPNRKHFNRKSLETDGHEEKETFSISGEQTDGLVCHSGIQMDTTALRVNRKRGGNSTTVRKFTERLEEPSRTLEERLATVNFNKMTKTREPYWKEYCNRREIITEKYEEWQKRIQR